MDLIVLCLGWAAYLSLHSILASEILKRWGKKLLGDYFHFYRVIYVVLSVIGLVIMLYLNEKAESEYLLDRNDLLIYLSLVFAAFGVILLKVTFKQYKFSEFIGAKAESNTLVTKGILGSIRHPIYLATILLLIGFWLYNPKLSTLISVLCIFFYLPIGIWLEERKLIKIYGNAYEEYKKKVPALIPRIW